MMKQLKRFTSELLKQNPQKIDLATAFLWFHYVTKNEEPTANQINEYFTASNLPKFNPTYLKEGLRKSAKACKGSAPNLYKPQRKFLDEMAATFPFVIERDEEIIADDVIIPNSLTQNTRGYIVQLSKQINGSYEHNIFDGCAILMRRLLEILLIHSYEHVGKIASITDGDGFKNLSFIINHTISTKPFPLSKEVVETLDNFRVVGNFSAHKIHYNAKRKDIDNIRLTYRLTVEELLYRSGLKK